MRWNSYNAININQWMPDGESVVPGGLYTITNNRIHVPDTAYPYQSAIINQPVGNLVGQSGGKLLDATGNTIQVGTGTPDPDQSSFVRDQVAIQEALLTVTNVTQAKVYMSIQAAVDAANPGDVIEVGTRVYLEEVTIDKQLTVLGPNADINPNTGTRNPEAIIMASFIGDTANYLTSLTIQNGGSGSVIKGLTFEGNNPDLESTIVTNGVSLEGLEGVFLTKTNNVTFENNIVQNYAEDAIYVSGYQTTTAYYGNAIRNNKVDNIGGMGNGTGIGMHWSSYAAIENNVLTRVRGGIQTGNLNHATPVQATIRFNQIEASRLGIWHNAAYGPGTLMVIEGNTISAIDNPTGTVWQGIWISPTSTASSTHVIDNTITSEDITQTATGLYAWSIRGSNNVLVEGGTISGMDYGLHLTTTDAGWGSAVTGTLILNDIVIENSRVVGVSVTDGSTNNAHVAKVIANNITISGGPTAILVSGPQASVVVSASNLTATTSAKFEGDATGSINMSNLIGLVENTGTIAIDVSSNWWGSVDGPVVDVNYSGLVTYCGWLDAPAPDGTLISDGGIVTNQNTSAIYCSIQEAVDAATAGDTLLLGAGLYTEQVTVDKALTLLGPNADKPGYATDRVAEATLTFPEGITALDERLLVVTADGVTLSGMNFEYLEAMIGLRPQLVRVLDANDTTITNNRFFGGETGVGTTVTGGAYYSGLLIEGNYIDGGPFVNSAYNRGLYIWNTAATIRNNEIVSTAHGVQILPTSEPIGGVVEENLINASQYPVYHNGHQGDSGEWSYLNNTISVAGVTQTGLEALVHTRIPWATSRDMYAIYFYNFGTAATTAPASVVVEGNVIDGTKPAVAYALLRINPVGVGASATGTVSPTIDMTSNSIINFTRAVAGLGTRIILDASGNWWGSNVASTVSSRASVNADFSPWLDSGTDTDTAAPGFQGDFSYLHVDDAGKHYASVGRIQEAIDMVSGSTVNVLPGSYPDDVNVNKAVNLYGANQGVDPNGTVARGAESIIANPAVFTVTAANAVVDGFSFEAPLVAMIGTTANNNIFTNTSGYSIVVGSDVAGAIADPLTGTYDLTLNSFSDAGDGRLVVYLPAEATVEQTAFILDLFHQVYHPGVSIKEINGADPFTYVVENSPIAVDDAYTTVEDTQLDVAVPGVLANDSDPEGDAFTAILVTNVTNGTLTLNADGSFTYLPNLDFFGTDTFTYKAVAGATESLPATVTITVTAVKDQVQAVDDFYSTDEDTVLTVPAATGVLFNDIDVDLNNMIAALVTNVSNGSLALTADGAFVYTPNANFHGTDTFTYRLVTYPAGIQNEWVDEAVVTITVNSVLDAPTLSTDIPASVYTGVETEYGVTLDNPTYGDAFTGVRVQFKLVNTDLADIASLQYFETFNSTWMDLPLTQDGADVVGWFGPGAGFPMPAPYNATSQFRLTMATGSAGTYAYEMHLFDVVADPDALLTSLSGNLEVLSSEIFIMEDFGLWGEAWPGAMNIGWRYLESFDLDTLLSIEVGMLDAGRNEIVKYTADAEQIAWQRANGYINPETRQTSAPFYTEYNGTPIAEGRDLDWTVIFGSAFADWNPRWGYIKVTTTTELEQNEEKEYLGARPDITDPVMEAVTPVEGALVLGPDETFILTADAMDDFLYSLEIDHSMEAVLPEFTVYADADNPYGSAEAAAQFAAAGVTVTYDTVEQIWTIDFGPAITAQFIENGGITFYLVLHDASGRTWGSMSPTTDENTYVYTLTLDDVAPTVDDMTAIGTAPYGDVPAVGLTITVEQGYTVDHVEINVSEPVIVADGTVVSLAGAPYGTITANGSLLTVTPYPGNEIASELGEFVFSVPVGSITDLKGNAMTTLEATLIVNKVNIFDITDFGLWGETWPGALSLGWGYLENFDLDTIATIEVGMLDASRTSIIKYTADAEQVAWQRANGYITDPGKLSSAPFYTEYDGTPIAEGRDDDWTVIFGAAFAEWNPGWGYVKVTTTLGTEEYEEIEYTGARPDITPPTVVDMTARGATGYADVIAEEMTFTVEQGYTVETIEITMSENVVVANGTVVSLAGVPYGTLTGVGNLLTVTPYPGNEVASALGTFVFSIPAGTVTDLAGHELTTLEATLIVIPVNIFDITDFGLWGETWPGALSLGWGYLENFDLDTIATIEVGMLDASRTSIIKYTADAEQVAWQRANGYITDPGKLSSAPFYTEYDGTPIAEGRDDDWTVIFGAAFAEWNPGWGYVKVTTTLGTEEYEEIKYTGARPDITPPTVVDMTARGATGYADVIAEEMTFTVEQGYTVETIEITMSENVVVADGTVVSLAGVPYGTLTGVGNLLTVTPYPGNEVASALGTFVFSIPAGTVTDLAGHELTTLEATLVVVNVAPVAADDSYTTPEDVALVVAAPGVLENDVDWAPLTAELVTGPANGTLVLNADGSFTYTPDANWHGTDTFTYKAYDGTDYSAVATVTITVTSVNDAPVAADDEYSTDEDVVLTVAAPGVLVNDSDVDGDTLSVSLKTNVAHGTLVLNGDGSFTYTPNANWFGTDSFVYTLISYPSVTAEGWTDEATVTITVNAVNDAPVAVDDAYSTAFETALTVAAPGVLGNDSDVEGSALSAALVAGPANGTLTLNANGSFTYTPAAGFSGTDTFTYKANDGGLDSNVATVTITVGESPVIPNTPPVAQNQTVTTPEDTAKAITLVATDADGDTLTYSIVAQPLHGTVTLVGNVATYTPAQDYNGADSFTFKANDATTDSNIATVSITVTPVNDAPVAVDDEYTVAEGAVLTITAPGVLTNDHDVDNTTLTAELVDNVTHGTLVLNANGSFTYTPEAYFNGTDSFTYIAKDGASSSEMAVVTITVTPVNNDVIANDDWYETPFNTALVKDAAEGVLANDVLLDPDETVSIVVLEAPQHGTLSINDDGSFTYTPDAGFFGRDIFRYMVLSVRVNGEWSDDANVIIIVKPFASIYLPLIFK